MDIKEGDLVVVACALTKAKQVVVVKAVNELNQRITYTVFDSGVSYDYWAYFTEVQLLPEQDKIIPELKQALNGVYFVDTL
jgi:hypothetical protein